MLSPRVAFLNMPFGTVQYPSIQAGLLKAIAERSGIQIDCFYANLDFARTIDLKLYNFLSSYRGPLLGEWLFAAAAFETAVPSDQEFIDKYSDVMALALERTGVPISQILDIRHGVVPDFLQKLSTTLLAASYDVVCFTSTFEQNVASIALAKFLKTVKPTIKTVFGGANFDGAMGVALAAGIPWVDVVVSGEADDVFVPLLRNLLGADEAIALPGVIWKHNLDSASHVRATYTGHMDDLPTPDYADYFSAMERHAFLDHEMGRPVTVLIEGSRGCWWGEKHHCKFCGLNGQGMGFRSKSTQRIISDIKDLSQRYRIPRINAVDNIIGRKQMKELAAFMQQSDLDYELFFEIKANLTRDEIQSLSEGCINHVQPGIESFSSHVLRLMDKGVSAAQNINSLRWFAYYGVHAFWNLIYGFPGETEEDYSRQAHLFQKLAFLPPPRGVGPIWIERFSPYFRDAMDGVSFANLRPHESYRYVYPPSVDIQQAAYFFQAELKNPVRREAVSAMLASIESWKKRWQKEPLPILTYQKMMNGVRVIDGRPEEEGTRSYFYTDWLAEVFLACVDKPVSASNIRQRLASETNWELTLDEITEALGLLIGRDLVIEDEGTFLALPIPIRRGRRGPAFRVIDKEAAVGKKDIHSQVGA